MTTWDTELAAQRAREAYCYVARVYPKGAPLEIQAAKLYREYRYWCEENGHRPQSSTRVADDWRRLGFERRRTKTGTVYRGLQLND
jgi:phage/plasmid-associated DNA primase